MSSPDEDPVIDVERLRRLLEHLTANPREHDQTMWGQRFHDDLGGACRTSYCAAGWAVVLDGRCTIKWRTDPYMKTFDSAAHAIDQNGEMHTIRNLACNLLGFSYDQGSRFFDSTNSLYRLWGYATVWTDGEIQRPDTVTPSGLRP